MILGHVDSMQGPAVFYRLRDLQPGDLVHVDAADGSTVTFRVVRLATYPNKKLSLPRTCTPLPVAVACSTW